jgi:hypothetical protein
MVAETQNTEVAEETFDLIDPDQPVKEFTPKQIANKGAHLVRMYRDQKTEFGEIEPEYLLGFRDGDCADLSEYADLKFPHPKPQDYYKVEYDEQMQPKGDAEFINIYNDITRTSKIDDPILIYFYRGRILVLNGMTRLSVIGQHRQIQPGFMRRIPFRLFVGSENLARGEMVRLNLDGRQRVIKPKEFFAMIEAYRDNNMTVGEIRKMISGSASGNYEINNTINIAYFGCDKLKSLFLAKKIPLGHAAEIANVEDPGRQEDILERLRKSDTLTKVKLVTRGKAAITPMVTELLGKTKKLREATENIGIHAHCKSDISAIESALKKLKVVVERADEDAANTAHENSHFSEDVEEEQGEDYGESEVVEQDESLAAEPNDATDTLLRLEEDKKAVSKGSQKPNKNEKPDKNETNTSYEFRPNENGDGNIGEHATQEELDKFVQVWWKKFASRPVTAGELVEVADDHDCFKRMRQLSSKKQTRSIWIAKNILAHLTGTKNAVGNYWWMRGFYGNRSVWKLQLL